MQLQMTAPLDIGLEQADPTLALGQEDMFDLGDAEKGLQRKGGISTLIGGDGDFLESDDGTGDGDEEIDVADVEDRERRMALLEAEMDGLYDAYQERMRERDAKFRVKESRQINIERDEWHGIQEKHSDDEDEDEDGGWDKMDEAKERAGEDTCDSDDSDDAEVIPDRKRRRAEPDASPSSKRLRLVKTLDDPKSITAGRAAQMWFSQGVFAGIDDLDTIEDDEVKEGLDMDGVEAWHDQVGHLSKFRHWLI
jgi:AdoMet-dependent rRNA methyltransferase SPB1